jgi:hypothetical protein
MNTRTNDESDRRLASPLCRQNNLPDLQFGLLHEQSMQVDAIVPILDCELVWSNKVYKSTSLFSINVSFKDPSTKRRPTQEYPLTSSLV